MDKRKIGIGIMIVAIFTIGIGIGLNFSNSKMNTSLFTIVGLILNFVGLLILVTANKKK